MLVNNNCYLCIFLSWFRRDYLFTGGSVILNLSHILPGSKNLICFYKHGAFVFTWYQIMYWSCAGFVCIIVIFLISCLDSHSDGTHSPQSIHCWANDATLHFSKLALMKKQTHLGWPEDEYIFSKMSFLGELMKPYCKVLPICSGFRLKENVASELAWRCHHSVHENRHNVSDSADVKQKKDWSQFSMQIHARKITSHYSEYICPCDIITVVPSWILNVPLDLH